MEQAWAARLRLRASSCSFDYTLGLQRVRLQLVQGPIRSAPAQLPELIAHSEFISILTPASAAPVAIVRGSTRLEVIDLTDGSSIFGEPIGMRGDSFGTLSPNGRVFTQNLNGSVVLRATEGGETLVVLPKSDGLLWLGTQAVALRGDSSTGNATRLLDVASGEETPIPTKGPFRAEMSVRVPGTAELYNFLSIQGAVQQIELVKVGERIQAKLRKEQRWSGRGFAVNTGGLSADGTSWVDGSNDLRRLNGGDPACPTCATSAAPGLARGTG